MCPACLAAAAWAVAGTTSAGGLTVFVARKLRGRKQSRPTSPPPPVAEESRMQRERPQ